jgi:2''-5'' RNA ligase
MDNAGNSCVIVAIPSVDDVVWKLSSEKIPHMTLCYLGDVIDDPQRMHILEYLEHVISTSMPYKFGMSVDRRGTLGPENADVLFFGDYNLQKLEQFRSYLLQDDQLYRMYNSVPQYPKFTPHLTMGYPSSPAPQDDRDYPGISWINFDRIALWTGDYSGPEFMLVEKSMDEVRMGDMGKISAKDILEHFGTKGMRWGIIRDKLRGGADSPDSSKVSELRKRAQRGGVRTLSDGELRTLNNRLNMEKKYSEAMSELNKKKDERRKFMLDILTTVGKEVISHLIRQKMTKTSSSRSSYKFVDGHIIEAGSKAIGSK